MIDERAIWLWADELCKAMGDVSVGEIERVLEYAHGFGTPIPEKHLITAFQRCFCNPPDRSESRSVLVRMGYIPAL